MYSHSKRMLPRKEEPFRAEFPSHYYSSSSVYSYTPTSSSDCPEHGRSHRRTTLILTISVIFATLGVISIAGVAAYLGILSKGSNNASQSEESYMLLNSNSKILADEDSQQSESGLYYGIGRSSHRDPISDIGNTLLETKSDNPASPSFEDIDADLNHHVHPPVTKIRFSQKNSTSVVTSKVKVNYEESLSDPNENDNTRSGPVAVKPSSSTMQQSSNSNSQQLPDSPSNPQQYPGRYSPQQHGSPPPPLNRYPPTNSHYAIHAVDNQNQNQQSHFLTHFDAESSSHQRNPVVTSGVLNFHDFHHQRLHNESKSNVNDKINTNTSNKDSSTESKVRRKEETLEQNTKSQTVSNKQEQDFALLAENGQGLAGSSSTYENIKKITANNKHNLNPISGFSKKNEGNNESHGWTMSPTLVTSTSSQNPPTNKPKQNIQPSASVGNGREQVIPVQPFFKTRTPSSNPVSISNQDQNANELLTNHRVHLTFDRIAPEFYDQNPWTPLVIRPTLDKKPRVEGEQLLPTTKPEHSSVPAQSKEMYYRYGDTASNVNVNLGDPGQNRPPVSDDTGGDNGPFRHALESDHNASVIKANDNVKPDKESVMSASFVPTIEEGEERIKIPPSTSSSLLSPNSNPNVQEEHEQEESEEDDDIVPPVPIPSFTVLIPHIPNPKPNNSGNKTETEANSVVNGNLSAEDGIQNEEFFTSQPAVEEDYNWTTSSASENKSKLFEERIGEIIQTHEIGKDDDYEDVENDDVDVEEPPQTNIYKLDIDLLPNTVAPNTETPKKNLSSSSEESAIKGPVEPNAEMRTTTDFILSTLGSLNLVKPLPTRSEVVEGDEVSKTESPLFPPIRSYVGINQPLRPKPSESDESEETKIILLSEPNLILHGDPHRKLRTDDDGLSPDLTTTSSFNKVLSMMMKFDENRTGNPLANLSAHNVQLVVAHMNYSAPIAAYLNDTNREQKSIHRDAKIDSRFRDFTEQIPVTLISTGPLPGFRPSKSNSTGKWNPNKISSITVTNSNSPVYKFVLRKGQSVEELLKEIFHNYTNKGIGNSTNQSMKGSLVAPSANIITTRPEIPGSSPGSVDIQFTTKTTTTSAPPSSTTTTPSPETTTEPEVNTSTSIVLNESENEECGTNSSFRCISNGACVSSFSRCNGIRDCGDNSDEQGCLCVDFLKSQMLHRKICDGIPDCIDFSDEYNCEWCTPGHYICAGSRACIPRDKICDGIRDCPRGDDEGDCVKIGHSGEVDILEDLSPIYHRTGHLMVRKKGIWGKLCVETFNTILSHWEIKDLARAVCKAKTFSDFETVERVEDEEFNPNEPYYELFDETNQNENDSLETSYPSSDSSTRSSIGFKLSPCKTKVVVKVTCQDLQCGTAPRAFTQAARIVGGSNALAGEWPWQAALYRDGEYQCGATLISSRWLLSAGHCFYHSQDDHWVARLGTLRRGGTLLSPYEQVIRITNIFLHPQYKDVGFINDVSLLRLETEVNFTDFVRPVCLPSKDTNIKDGRMCTVVGWGQLFEVGRVFPDTLQEVQLPLISTTECRKRTVFLPLYKLTDEMFCAGFDRGGRDACLGDSGGPLMCPESDGRWSLYGVTSNGYGCARANRPGVYTKVASYLDWIYDKMNKHDNVSYRDKAKPCRGHRCPLGECLEQRRICDGISHCLEDGSDERNCTWS